jgi:cysteine desulfurase
VGKIPLDVEKSSIDLLSMTAHKLYGPKGIGALYVRSRNPKVRLAPTIHGGGHEAGLRSGTLNVPGIVGFGKACALARVEMSVEAVQLTKLREKLNEGIFERLDEVYLNGHPTERLPGNLNLSFAYVEGESLLMGLNDVAVSSGSTCTSAKLEPSHVLRAMGVKDYLTHSAIRFGLGRFNTAEEVDHVARRVGEEVSRLRKLSPAYAKRGVGRRQKDALNPTAADG